MPKLGWIITRNTRPLRVHDLDLLQNPSIDFEIGDLSSDVVLVTALGNYLAKLDKQNIHCLEPCFFVCRVASSVKIFFLSVVLLCSGFPSKFFVV